LLRGHVHGGVMVRRVEAFLGMETPEPDLVQPSDKPMPVTKDGPLGGFTTVGQAATELDFELTQFQSMVEKIFDEDIGAEEYNHNTAEALKLKREIIERYTPRSAIREFMPWWIPPVRYDKDRGYFLDRNDTLVAVARVSIADHMQEKIAEALNLSTDRGSSQK
jgi:hypothetical protein